MNIMRFRPLFLFISLALVIISLFSIIKWGFLPSADFIGGSIWDIKLSQEIKPSQIEQIFADQKIELSQQTISNQNLTLKFNYINQEDKIKLETKLKSFDPNLIEQKFETIGPSLGRELLNKTIVAVILSSFALLIFIGSKFKDFSFGISAILAMFHDTFILIGAFSLLGHFWGAQLDSLFVTALLTTLSASVHDTVVTFDRIRELRRRDYKLEWVALANQAVSEVIVRSINNSMTIIFMLTSLVALGGLTTRWFALALLIGVICGTYSSSAVAIPLVLYWKNKKSK